nr:hypothetical protein [Tanacetum cinerariifolium]
MVAYLEKSEGSEGCRQIIDFLSQTAALSIIEDGVMAITATIDRNVKQHEESLQGISGVITSLFDTMLVQHQHGEPSTPKSSPLRITSSPSLSPQHTLIHAPSTSQPPNIQTTPVAEETTPMPHNLPLQSVHSLRRDDERTVKTSKAKRKARIGISDDEDVEDPSKQGMSLIEELDMDVDISLVSPHAADQGRKSDETKARDKGKVVMQESMPTKKIKKRIQVQMSIDEELARKLHKEELARFNAEQEAIDIARKEKVIAEGDQAHDIDWSDPAVIRYDTLQNRPRSVTEVEVQRSKRTIQEVKRQSTEEEKGKKSDDSSKPTRKKTLSKKRAEDEFVMEVKSLATKYPIIDWKTHVLTEYFMYYQIIRADGSSKNYKIFSEMLDDFDRQDVMDLHRLVEEREEISSWSRNDIKDVNKRLEVEQESEMAFELLRRSPIVSFHNDLSVLSVTGYFDSSSPVVLRECGTPLYGFSRCRWCTYERCGVDLRDGICPLYHGANDQLTSICKMACQIVQKKLEEKQIEEEQAAKAQNRKLLVCYDDDDDEEESNSLKDNIISELPPCSAITPSEPVDSLSMGDEHLDTIPATESDEVIKSSVEDLVPIPSEFEGENGCDVPSCFTTFSNILFDADYDFKSVDDQSLHNEDVSEKMFSNPLFEEEIISIRIDQQHFNAESDLVESMLNCDSSVISSSSKIDSLLDEFVG